MYIGSKKNTREFLAFSFLIFNIYLFFEALYINLVLEARRYDSQFSFLIFLNTNTYTFSKPFLLCASQSSLWKSLCIYRVLTFNSTWLLQNYGFLMWVFDGFTVYWSYKFNFQLLYTVLVFFLVVFFSFFLVMEFVITALMSSVVFC